MANPKTTLGGYLILVCTAWYLGARLYHGTVSPEDFSAVVAVLAGIGLINAADGSH